MTTIDRNKEISKLVKEGQMSYVEIGRLYGITGSRVRTIHNAVKSKEELDKSTDNFSVLYRFLNKDARSTNALFRMGIQTPEQMLEMYITGDILKVRNIGSRSLENIRKCLEDNGMICKKPQTDSNLIDEIEQVYASSTDPDIKEMIRKRHELKEFLNHALAYRVLMNYGITSLDELKLLYEEDNELTKILELRSIGVGTINHIKRRLGWKPDEDIIPEYLKFIKNYCLSELKKGMSYESEIWAGNNDIYDVIISYNKCSGNHYLNINIHYYDENDEVHFDNYFFTWYLKYSIENYSCNGKNINVVQFKELIKLMEKFKEKISNEQKNNDIQNPGWEICYFCDKKNTTSCDPAKCDPMSI